MTDLDKRLDPDEGMPRRRAADQPTGNLELILYQITELKAAVREGFTKMEGRFDAAESRISALERFREREEERARTAAQQSNQINSRWLPFVLAILGLAVTITLFLVGGGA